jgi:hypothetical protein
MQQVPQERRRLQVRICISCSNDASSATAATAAGRCAAREGRGGGEVACQAAAGLLAAVTPGGVHVMSCVRALSMTASRIIIMWPSQSGVVAEVVRSSQVKDCAAVDASVTH